MGIKSYLNCPLHQQSPCNSKMPAFLTWHKRYSTDCCSKHIHSHVEHPTHKLHFLHGFRWSTWEVFFTDWFTGGFGITFLVYENQCQSLIRNKNQDQRDGSPSKGTGHHSSIPGAYMVEAINHLVALLPPHRLWHASPQTHNFILFF